MSYLSRRLFASQRLPILLVWYSSPFVFFDGQSDKCLEQGHRWCLSCLKKHKGDPLCGECRQPKGKPHRIYLDLEDLVDDQVALVTDSLNSINMDPSPSDIEKFDRAVRKLRQKHSTDPAVSVCKPSCPTTMSHLLIAPAESVARSSQGFERASGFFGRAMFRV